ncbi:MAG: CDGSH iron-sulfur domain-containing protein [Chloroflexi bacterium]|nr:CDGSH iron-sulfur domain-containing protein [Chloroflexota bacterium]
MAKTRVTPLPNGPYLVAGQIELVDSEGKEFPVQGEKAYLCRCGASAKKPFCDGSHTRINFQAPTKAV